MTSKHQDNQYDASRMGHTASPGPGYSAYPTSADRHSSGQVENGYNGDGSDNKNNSQAMNTAQLSYAQGIHAAGGSSAADYGGRLGNASSASKPDDERKLFVGGLTWDTTQDDLREYFSNFGTVADCSIKHDPATGRSRGFAFLIFDSKDVVEKILAQADHFVKGRKVDPKPAHRRLAGTTSGNNPSSLASTMYGGLPSQQAMSYGGMNMMGTNQYNNNRKVFIGGLDPTFPESQLREYFSRFGKVDEIDLPYDKEKNERRPFCFISFDSEQAAQEVLRLQRHTIGEMTVDVKRAKPKTLTNQQQAPPVYDPYGQQASYTAYGTGAPTYNTGNYAPTDPYGQWGSYTYNQQPSPATYQYGGSSTTNVPNPGSYSQYPQQPSSAQYQYAPSATAAAGDYYSHYGYNAQQPASVYTDPNAAYSGYDYASYYASVGTGMTGSIGDNGGGAQQGGSSANPVDYEHDNHYGKAKTSIVASPTYHPYSRT